MAGRSPRCCSAVTRCKTHHSSNAAPGTGSLGAGRLHGLQRLREIVNSCFPPKQRRGSSHRGHHAAVLPC
jgi:hypothetical protein